jgi:hypothetical protein
LLLLFLLSRYSLYYCYTWALPLPHSTPFASVFSGYIIEASGAGIVPDQLHHSWG